MNQVGLIQVKEFQSQTAMVKGLYLLPAAAVFKSSVEAVADYRSDVPD
jgi:hypothetical protein